MTFPTRYAPLRRNQKPRSAKQYRRRSRNDASAAPLRRAQSQPRWSKMLNAAAPRPKLFGGDTPLLSETRRYSLVIQRGRAATKRLTAEYAEKLKILHIPDLPNALRI